MAYSAELYVHDLDRQAADALNQFPKFVKLLESYSANYDEKAAKIDLLSTAIRLGEKQMPEGITRHKCAVCGKTENDGEDLVFRFCTKCNGNYEYCSEHIYTHEHVK